MAHRCLLCSSDRIRMHMDRDAVTCDTCGATLTGREMYDITAMRMMKEMKEAEEARRLRDARHKVYCPECRESSTFGPIDPGDYRLLDCAHAFFVRAEEPGVGEYLLTTEPPV